MWWRSTRADYRPGGGNRRAFRALLDTDSSVGLLAYGGDADSDQERVVGWCAVAPREAYRRLENTVVGRGGVNEPDRWAVPCFFIGPGIVSVDLPMRCSPQPASTAELRAPRWWRAIHRRALRPDRRICSSVPKDSSPGTASWWFASPRPSEP